MPMPESSSKVTQNDEKLDCTSIPAFQSDHKAYGVKEPYLAWSLGFERRRRSGSPFLVRSSTLYSSTPDFPVARCLAYLCDLQGRRWDQSSEGWYRRRRPFLCVTSFPWLFSSLASSKSLHPLSLMISALTLMINSAQHNVAGSIAQFIHISP